MISICMATYNGEKFLKEQIDSILLQLKEDDELIISDDGSTDSTIDIINSYNDPRIKLLHNEINHGVNGNFENALRNAKGDYIFLSDQDDVWLSGKVKTCLKALENADCIVHDAIVVDQNLKLINKSLFKLVNKKRGLLNNIIHNSFTGCCMAFKRKTIELTIPLPKYDGFYYDQWFGLVCLINYNVKFIDDSLIYHRRSGYNTSTLGSKSNLNLKQKFYYRIKLIKELLKFK